MHRNIRCYDLDGNFIGNYDTVKKASEKLNIGTEAIYRSLNGNGTCLGKCIFLKENDDIENRLKNISKTSYKKPVLQYDKNGIFVREFESTSAAARHIKRKQPAIYYCANHNDIETEFHRKVGGYYWINKKSDDIPPRLIIRKYESKARFTIIDMNSFSKIGNDLDIKKAAKILKVKDIGYLYDLARSKTFYKKRWFIIQDGKESAKRFRRCLINSTRFIVFKTMKNGELKHSKVFRSRNELIRYLDLCNGSSEKRCMELMNKYVLKKNETIIKESGLLSPEIDDKYLEYVINPLME